MATIKLTGKITDIFHEEKISQYFTKKEFWVQDNDKSARTPQHWAIELHNQDCDRLKSYSCGDVVEVEVEVRGRKYKRKSGSEEAISLSLKCVGISKLSKASPFKDQSQINPRLL